jgi:prevent-host-death family protein
METVNIHAAKTHLSRLVDKAAAGHPFVIAKAGKPLVQVTAIPTPRPADRLGFMAGQIAVPDDFDTLGKDIIETLFGHHDGA